MDLVHPQEHHWYVPCASCNTVLAVGVPCKRMMCTVTVKCGHCNSLSYFNPRPIVQSLASHHNQMDFQGPCTEYCKHSKQLLQPSSASSEQTSPKAPYVAKHNGGEETPSPVRL